MAETIAIQLNGRVVRVPVGVSVAAAVYHAGENRFRRSVTGEARAPLCGMGICLECKVTIDSRSNCRSCQIAAREGMVIQTS